MRLTRCLEGPAPRWLMVGTFLWVLGISLPVGCGGRPEPASSYAEAVYDEPPVYCYRTLGDVDCYKRPLLGAERRLVNYYGPPPGDYEWPEPPPAPRLHAPPPGRPVPDPEAAPTPEPTSAPAAATDNQPTLLHKTKVSSAGPPPRFGESAVADNAATSVIAAPRPRPAASASASPQTTPLVIEVEGR